MADKIWTAKDIELSNQIRLIRHESEETGQDVLTVYRDYRYVDDTGETMPELITKIVAKDYVMASLPQDMEALLVKLDTLTRAEALKNAGME